MKTTLFILSFIISCINLYSQPLLNWEKKYDGPVNLNDCINDMDIDPNNGDVYVTGTSDTSKFADYLTIKYSSSGKILWKRRYDGPDNLNDQANAIKYDPLKNRVYVTGKSAGTTSNYDFLTICYNASTGDTLWTRRFNGSSNKNSADEAVDIDVDGSGSAYIVGTGYTDYGSYFSQAIIIKYDTLGALIWWDIRDNLVADVVAQKITASNTGVYMLFSQLKYQSTISIDETDVYGYYLNGNSISVVNVPVSYDDYIPIHFDFTHDVSSNVYICGRDLTSNQYDMFVRKLTSNLNSTAWKFTYSGPSNKEDIGISVKVDDSQNVYFTGYTDVSQANVKNYNIISFKLDKNGQQIWKSPTYDGGSGNPSFNEDKPVEIALGCASSNEPYVVGYKTNSEGKKDIIILKYKTNGDVSTGYPIIYGFAGCNNIPSGIHISGCNIYVSGCSECNSDYSDYVTLKYCNFTGNTNITRVGNILSTNSSGTIQWILNGVDIPGANSQTYTITQIGNYSVRVTVNDCEKTSSQFVVTELVPKANFVATTSSTITVGESVSFMDLSTNNPTNWKWTFSGGSIVNPPSADKQTIFYNNVGKYLVKLVAANAAGSDSLTILDYVTVLPIVVKPVTNFIATTSTNIIVGQSVSFKDLSTNNPTSWNWTFDGGNPKNPSSSDKQTITYNTSGTFYVKLVSSNSAGSDSLTKFQYVTVSNGVPIVDFKADSLVIPIGYSVQFMDLSTNNPDQWFWEFEKGNLPTSQKQTPDPVKYTEKGCWKVSLTAHNIAGNSSKVTKNCYITVIKPTSSIDVNSYISKFQIFPNPAKSNINIQLDSEEDMNLDFSIINITGEVLKDFKNYKIETGTNSIQLSLENIPAGNYYVVAQNTFKSVFEIKKIVVME